MLKVRTIELDYAEALKNNRFYHNDDPVSTHFFNALQTIFPSGERFFIDLARDSLVELHARSDDPSYKELEERVKAFIQQEARHAKEHSAVAKILEESGYEFVKPHMERQERLRLHNNKTLSLHWRAAFTAAVEHFTSSFAYVVLLKDSNMIESFSDPSFRALFFYHAVEEVEHRCIAHEISEKIGVSSSLRILSFLLIILDQMINIRLRQRLFMQADGKWDFKYRIRTWKFVWGFNGVAWQMLPILMSYLKPGFDPERVFNAEEIARINVQCEHYGLEGLG